jgi:hypothetical protein
MRALANFMKYGNLPTFFIRHMHLYAFLHPIFTICCHESQNIAILATASLGTVKNNTKTVVTFSKIRT